jgi:hypothetical protein
MQILTMNNRNFQIHSRNPSNRTKVKILGKKFLDSSLKKNLVLRMLSNRGNVRTSKFWQKSKEKKRIFFSKIYEGHIGIWFRLKKIKIISCLCTFNFTCGAELGTGNFSNYCRHWVLLFRVKVQYLPDSMLNSYASQIGDVSGVYCTCIAFLVSGELQRTAQNGN